MFERQNDVLLSTLKIADVIDHSLHAISTSEDDDFDVLKEN